MFYLNKWKIYTESSTGRGSGSEASRSFMPGLFITTQKLSLSIIHLRPSMVIVHLMCPPRTLKPSLHKNLQDEIYDAVINIIVYLKINTNQLQGP